jgi:hypothetical protein
MHVESIIIANEANDILFACHFLPPAKSWNDYIDRLVTLLPGWDPLVPFLLHDDLAIGLGILKDLRLIITAPLTSNFVLEVVMAQAIEHIKKILSFLVKDDPLQPNLLKRDTYISLQMLFQAEISASGHMRFGSPSDFSAIVEF